VKRGDIPKALDIFWFMGKDVDWMLVQHDLGEGKSRLSGSQPSISQLGAFFRRRRGGVP